MHWYLTLMRIAPVSHLHVTCTSTLDEAKAANPKQAGGIYSQVSQMVVL